MIAPEVRAVLDGLRAQALAIPASERAAFAVERARRAKDALSPGERQRLRGDWRLWGRAEQIMPAGNWRVWLVMAGRGWGKSRTGVEAVREWARDPRARIALVAPTAADARKVIVEGESGILAVSTSADRPFYMPSIRELRWPNGARGYLYSAEEPERLRGPQHHFCYADEIAVYPEPQLLWDNLKFGLRLGREPKIIATTTPRPSRFLQAILADPGTVTSRGSTFANRANLPKAALDEFARLYGGTRIGRQELEGELLEEAEGALWSRARIEALRVKAAPELIRICVAIDPSVSSGGPESDECGIVACGLGVDGHGYVLRDLSGRMSPDDWGQRAVAAYDSLSADKIIAEANQGGELITSLLRTIRPTIPFEKVHASRGKITRAEPISALTEQGKIHMVGGFPQLEDELTNYIPGSTKSPNRLDAMVWAFSFLMLKPARIGRVLGV